MFFSSLLLSSYLNLVSIKPRYSATNDCTVALLVIVIVADSAHQSR